MLGVLIVALVTVAIGYFLLKGYKTQTIIATGGMILLVCAILLGKPIIALKESTGDAWFDIFKVVENLLSNRVAGLGLMIMAVAGFVKYMDHIGASKAFVNVGIKPLYLFRSPYIVLALAFVVGQTMKVAIISAAGLGILLMATMYPILINLGVSRLSASAVIVTSSCIDLGPVSATSQLVAKNAGIDAVTYVAQYQIFVAIPVILTVAVLHYLVQKWFDSKDGQAAQRLEAAAPDEANLGTAPKIYALLPVLPLVLIFVFSPIFGSKIKLGIISAMLIGIAVSMIFELIRSKDFRTAAGGIQKFFDGMGASFATVVSLVVAAEIFAAGILSLGVVDTVIKASQTAGLGEHAMIAVMQAIVAGATFITGSGDGTLFSFASLAPAIVKHLGTDPVHMLLPMQFMASAVRSMSPVSAVCIAVAGLAAVSPMNVAKRTTIPVIGALVVTTIVNFLLL